jgi:hypothetical protein
MCLVCKVWHESRLRLPVRDKCELKGAEKGENSEDVLRICYHHQRSKRRQPCILNQPFHAPDLRVVSQLNARQKVNEGEKKSHEHAFAQILVCLEESFLQCNLVFFPTV